MDNLDDVISEMSSIKDLISDLLKEQRITNALLSSLVASRSQQYILPDNLHSKSQKSFTIVHDKYASVENMVLDIARRDGKRFSSFSGDSEEEIVALISSSTDGAYILIDNQKIITSPGIKRIVLEAYKNCEMSITVGKGIGARELKVEIPKINFVIFTNCAEIVSSDIKEVFPIVNKVKRDLEENR